MARRPDHTHYQAARAVCFTLAMSNAYRTGPEQFVRLRLAQVNATREDLQPIMSAIHRVFSARMSRILGGAVGICGALLTVGTALAGGSPAPWLAGASLFSVAAWAVGRFGFHFAARGLFDKADLATGLTGHADADLARLDAVDPIRTIERKLDPLELWAAVLPLTAVSLLAPLTLHLIVGLLFGGSGSIESIEAWIKVCMVLVGHAHLALVAMVFAFGQRMARADDAALADMNIRRAWRRAIAVAVGVSCVPGIVLVAMPRILSSLTGFGIDAVAVPPILSTLTGLAFIPAMYARMHKIARGERQVLRVAREIGADVRLEPEQATMLVGAGPVRIGEIEAPADELDLDPAIVQAKRAHRG